MKYLGLYSLAVAGVLAAAFQGDAKQAPDKPAYVELEADRKPQIVTKGDCFIKNGTLLTVTNGVIQNGSILVKGGKIVAIGKDLAAPDGVPVIDAAGKFVSPGIID